MSERTHFEILKQGAEAWNSWRLENPSVLPQLAMSFVTGSRGDESNAKEVSDVSMAGVFGGTTLPRGAVAAAQALIDRSELECRAG